MDNKIDTITLENLVNNVNYKRMLKHYVPSTFALEFINFIKLVNGTAGEENKTPVIHYHMLDQLLRSRDNLFVSFRGSAKALEVNTKVMTPTGFTRMGDLAVGDTVIDRNGMPTKITHVSDIYTNQCYRIELSNGDSFIANEDHLHIVEKLTSGGNYRELVLNTKDLIDIRNNRQLFIPVIKHPIQYTKKDFNVSPYFVGKEYVLDDETEGFDLYMYSSVSDRTELLQGILDTVGRINKRGAITVSSKDLTLLNKIKTLVKGLGGYASVSPSLKNQFRVYINIPHIKPFKNNEKYLNMWKRGYTFKYENKLLIEKITKIDAVVESKCISVESKTKSYLIEDAIITHNTSLLHEYMYLYLATYGHLPNFGKVNVAMYISDTMDNGVKSMRKNLEFRYNNSEFLQHYVPEARFTDMEWEFTNINNKKFFCRGFGASALPLDTILYTEDGKNTTIGKVQVGDKIYGANGKLCTVKIKSNEFFRPVYKINLDDGRSLEVCEEHINNVIFRKSNKDVYTFKEENILTKELLKRNLYNTRSNRNTKEHIAFIKNTLAIDYPYKEGIFDPYTLGVLLGDGSLKKDGSCIFHCHKDDLSTYLGKIPYKVGTKYLDKRNNNVYTVSLLDIYTDIEALGLRGVLMDKKFIPSLYFSTSIKQRKELLAGLLDTDGHITKNGRIEFVNTSEQLVNDVARLVRTLGGSASVKRSFIKGKHNDNGFNRKDAFKCEIWLIDEDICNIPRKKDRLIHNKNRKRWIKHAKMVAISSIEQVETVTTQCIGVDSEDNLFLAGNDLVVTHNTGVRGFKQYGERPTVCGLDDLMSDKNAESPTIVQDIENIIYKAARQALHPTRRIMNWTGTPFNKKDPLYKAAGSKVWNTTVYPICEKYPCTKEEFSGAWEDRFPYEFIELEYNRLLELGKIDAFNQELMLRIVSDEDRLVRDSDIVWYDVNTVLNHKDRYNFYITTDFAVSEKDKADFSVLLVWAYTSNGEWLLVDYVVKKQLMNANIEDLFRLVLMYKPQSVGIELSGQQKGFISWIKDEMLRRNIFFTLASDKSSGEEGLRPTNSKLVRFNTVVPLFRMKKIWFPRNNTADKELQEILEELTNVTVGGIKSKHDDCIDPMSQLLLLDAWKPYEDTPAINSNSVYGTDEQEEETNNTRISSYVV